MKKKKKKINKNTLIILFLILIAFSSLYPILNNLAYYLAIAACCLFLWITKTARGKGWYGEFKVKCVLKRTKPGERYVINNLMLLSKDGRSSQIDHILINKNGVFVIETKNYSGRIYGKTDDQEWTQVLNYGKSKHKLYNPIKQNATHVRTVQEVIGTSAPVISAVVFVKGNINFIKSPNVYRLRELKHLLKSYFSKTLTAYEMENIYTTLNEARADITLSEHVRRINSTCRK